MALIWYQVCYDTWSSFITPELTDSRIFIVKNSDRNHNLAMFTLINCYVLGNIRQYNVKYRTSHD